MISFVKKLHRKLLIICFQIKQRLHRWYGTRPLDYPKRRLHIMTDTLREYETRAMSCAKEPETIAWIEAACATDNNQILYDIGANIGAYSLVGAANGATVYAFEPAYQNFYRLNENVTLNHFDEQIHCFPVGFSHETKCALFTYLDLTTGTSRAFFNEKNQFHIPHSTVAAKKSTLIYSLDDFIATFRLPPPTMLKIDVDGAEADIVAGAKKTLADSRLSTILIEIDTAMTPEKTIMSILEAYGFSLDSKHLRGDTIYNYIFSRR